MSTTTFKYFIPYLDQCLYNLYVMYIENTLSEICEYFLHWWYLLCDHGDISCVCVCSMCWWLCAPELGKLIHRYIDLWNGRSICALLTRDTHKTMYWLHTSERLANVGLGCVDRLLDWIAMSSFEVVDGLCRAINLGDMTHMAHVRVTLIIRLWGFFEHISCYCLPTEVLLFKLCKPKVNNFWAETLF